MRWPPGHAGLLGQGVMAVSHVALRQDGDHRSTQHSDGDRSRPFCCKTPPAHGARPGSRSHVRSFMVSSPVLTTTRHGGRKGPHGPERAAGLGPGLSSSNPSASPACCPVAVQKTVLLLSRNERQAPTSCPLTTFLGSYTLELTREVSRGERFSSDLKIVLALEAYPGLSREASNLQIFPGTRPCPLQVQNTGNSRGQGDPRCQQYH